MQPKPIQRTTTTCKCKVKMDWEPSYFEIDPNSLINATFDEVSFSQSLINPPAMLEPQTNFPLDCLPCDSASFHTPITPPLLSVTAHASCIMRTELATNLFIINTPYLNLQESFPLTIQLKSQKKGTPVGLERVSCSYYSTGALITFTIGKKGYNDDEFLLQILQDRTIIAEVNRIKVVSHGIPAEKVSYRDFVFDFFSPSNFSKMDHFVDTLSQKKSTRSETVAKRKSHKFRCEYGCYPHFQAATSGERVAKCNTEQTTIESTIDLSLMVDIIMERQKIVKEKLEQVETLVRTMTSCFISLVNTEAEAIIGASKAKLEQIHYNISDLGKILESMQEPYANPRNIYPHLHVERVNSIRGVENNVRTHQYGQVGAEE